MNNGIRNQKPIVYAAASGRLVQPAGRGEIAHAQDEQEVGGSMQLNDGKRMERLMTRLHFVPKPVYADDALNKP